MNTKKVLILTGTTSDSNTSYQEVFDLTLSSKRRYAKKHGYDIMELRSFGSDTQKRFKDDQIGFLRAVRVFDMIQAYDVVMWIDADSIITNDSMCVKDFQLDDHCCFYASYDWEWMRSFSTGNFIVNRTKDIEKFVEVFYELSSKFPEEQLTLNTMYDPEYPYVAGLNSKKLGIESIVGKHDLRNKFKILPHAYLGAIPNKQICGKEWLNRNMIRWPWKRGDFLVHLTGLTNTTRIRVAKENFREYL